VIYFDTSYLLKCYINENGSAEVRELAAGAGRIACCEYGRGELFSGFHRCLREGKLTRGELDVIIEQYETDESDHIWSWLPFGRSLIASVVTTFKTLPEDVFLRTGDAIHLVCARNHDLPVVYTSDQHMLRAAPFLGLDARNVITAER
jgi:predicted nucleic acid-binding protein